MALAFALFAGANPHAHRRDEYLQAARLSIDVTRVQIELDLTPGIAIADRVIRAIDVDANGTIESGEEGAYVARIVHDITLDVDALPLTLTDVGRNFPTTDRMRAGEGAIRVTLEATVAEPRAGPHRVHFHNTHQSDIGVYLANALVPSSDRIAVGRQQRDQDQRDIVIDYVLRPAWITRGNIWFIGAAGCALLGLAVALRRRSKK